MNKYIFSFLCFSLMIITSFTKDDDLLNFFPANMVKRNQNTDIDHVIKATVVHYIALAPTNIIIYAHKVSQDSRRIEGDITIHKLSMSFRNIGRDCAPEETPKTAIDRLNYLSTWIAMVKPIKTLQGQEINSLVWIIGRETPAFGGNEVPYMLLPAMYNSGNPVVIGLNEIEPEKVKKALSRLVVWQKDKRVFYQEAMHKRDGEEGQTLWEDIKTLSLPEDGPFYIIVDVGIGEKGEKKILDRFENERKFQKRMEELEKGTNTVSRKN